MNLSHRVAVITGSGIGRATAFSMARRGTCLAPVGYWNLLKKALKS